MWQSDQDSMPIAPTRDVTTESPGNGQVFRISIMRRFEIRPEALAEEKRALEISRRVLHKVSIIPAIGRIGFAHHRG